MASAEVCWRAGCTYRELDHWILTGLVSPTVAANGTGTRRLFDMRELAWIQAVVQMRSAGLQVEAIRRALDCPGEIRQMLDGIEAGLEGWRKALPSWA